MKKMNIKKEQLIVTAIAAFALLFFPVTTTNNTTQQAFAAGATGTLDPNGLLRLDPVAGYSYSIGSEFYIGSAIKNFRESDDSMRIDFKGKETDSLILAGYVNVVKGDGNNPNICTEDPGEEISTKINGGPHTGPNSDPGPQSSTDITPWASENSADTIDVGNINFAGDAGRVRAEKTHPNPLPSINMETGGAITYPNVSLCDVSPDDWIGFMTIKLNRDTDCNGKFDEVWLGSYIDTSGLNADGTPQNKWTPQLGGDMTVFAKFKPTDADIPLKAIFQYWGQYASVNHPTDTYQTVRIDDQDYDAWTNEADPPYKHITLKQITNIHKDTCPTVNAVNPALPAANVGIDEPDGLAATATEEEEGQPLEEAVITEEETTNNEAVESNEDSDVVTQSNEEDLEQTQDPQSADNNDTTADEEDNTEENNNNDE